MLDFVLRHGKVRLGYQPPVIRKILFMNEAIHCDLHGYVVESQAGPVVDTEEARRQTPLRSDQFRIACIRDEILMVAKLEKVSETA